MTDVATNLAEFIFFVITAMFVQNSVFARGFGVSRLVKLVGDSTVDSMIFCALLCLVQVISAPLGFFANTFLDQPQFWYRDYIRPLCLSVCTIIAFIVVLLILSILPIRQKKEIIAVLPMASFSCAILGPMLISATQNYTFNQTMGFALGSGLGYSFAVLIVTEGQRKLLSRKVPSTLRGLPINLLYIGILALAIYGLTGHRLAL